ncbi:MAG: M50 family metallopeptidase [Alphaproteobacteria bacterium]
MNQLLSFIVVILVLVFFHELGHFLFARLFKMKVEVFSIGMGPEIISRRDKKGTIWRLALIPIGGYIKLLEGKANKDIVGSFESRPIWQRMIMVLAGPAFSILFGWLIFLSSSIIWGKAYIPNYNEVGINKVVVDSPAQKSGLKTGDIITSIVLDDKKYKVNSFYDIYNIIQKSGSNKIKLIVNRNNEELKLFITPKAYTNNKDEIVYRIGVSSPQLLYKKVGFVESFKIANEVSLRAMIAVYNGIIDTFQNGIKSENVGGPIKIANISGQSIDMGIIYFLHFMALLSINLGVLNMIPLPILDGGRIVLLMVEFVIGRPLPDKLINPIMLISVLLMLILFFFILALDLGII